MNVATETSERSGTGVGGVSGPREPPTSPPGHGQPTKEALEGSTLVHYTCHLLFRHLNIIQHLGKPGLSPTPLKRRHPGAQIPAACTPNPLLSCKQQLPYQAL